ncbi:MAG: hypothetical protein HQK81_09120 [Desulfovibrionaceae bacterium]|nr:hypothetical protein [Desulfovibrionaceae bacterium]MBF0514205.1 hypothetical protein [Desulfovibrionaceae bacterium]
MNDEILDGAKSKASQGGRIVIGVAGDDWSVMDAAKKAAALWGSRAVSGDDGKSWYVRVKMGHVVFQLASSSTEQDYQIG